VMLCLSWAEYIIPFFIGYSVLIFAFIAMRKYLDQGRTRNELKQANWEAQEG